MTTTAMTGSPIHQAPWPLLLAMIKAPCMAEPR
jgi:hypothetical protein